MTLTPERIAESGVHIVSAAMRHGDLTYHMPPPNRHGDMIAYMTRAGLTAGYIAECDQGFWTSDGRFVDRIEGAKIANRAGQRKRFSGERDTLYTEDMW